MRLAALWLVIGLLACLACGGSNQGAGSEPAADPDQAETKAERPSAEGKSWGGWRWKGKRDDCFFVVKNKCFDNQAEACAAAGCDEDRCKLTGGGPAKVSCSAR
jgi:hypothetical protein